MKKNIFFILLVFSSSMSYAAVSAKDFFSKEEIDYTSSGNIITLVRLKYNDDIVSDKRFKNQTHILKKNHAASWVYAGEMMSIEKGFIPYKKDASSDLIFYNNLLSFSSLAGMKYYSHKARSVEPFILKAYRIGSPENKSRINDIRADKIDDKKTNYFLMADNKFGELIFRSDLYSEVNSEGNNFILVNSCVHPIKKFGVKINDSEEYVTISYFLYDIRRKGYFYYTVSALRIKSDFFLKINAISPKGFGNRLRAGTVHLVGKIGINWNDKIKAFE